MNNILGEREYPSHVLPRYNYDISDYWYVITRGKTILPRNDYRYVIPKVLPKNFYGIDYLKDSISLATPATSIEVNQILTPIQFVSVNVVKIKKNLALLLPGHNEEMIIQTTISSAIAAGMNKEDIYVVDDNSNDNTRLKAIESVGSTNVMTVERSGKALAALQAIRYFNFESNYEWLHISDADSIFGTNYFNIYRDALKEASEEHVVAVGFVQSLRGNWIANYRALAYTYGQQIIRRWQSWFGMITVLPGPTTCFRTDVLQDLDFATGSLTEDFDLTLQIYRHKLGKILYIPGAVNYTQDPKTLRDFCKQTIRWQRGFFQCLVIYRFGRRLQKIDISIGFTLIQFLLYLAEMGIVVPYIVFKTGRWDILGAIFLADFFIVSLLTIFSSAITKRISIMSSLPYFYFLRFLEMGILVWAFVEVVVFRRFPKQSKGWGTEGRRFALDAHALKDVAI